MDKKEEKKERVRKAYAPNGSRTQKMMTFRLDDELRTWLEQQVNKGRYINNLIAEDMARCSIS